MAQTRRHDAARLAPLTAATDAAVYGVRAAALADAAARGVAVVESWCLSVNVFRDAVHELLPPAHDPASLIRVIHRPAGLERAARARDRILSLPIPGLAEELEELWTRAAAGAGWGLMARVSPTCNDDLARGAGLDTVRYGLRNGEALENAIRELWAQALSAAALGYLRARRERDLALGVVIQRLPPATASGVLFARDPEHARGIIAETSPASGERPVALPVRVIAAAPGLGARLVDGAPAFDVVRFTSDGVITERRAAAKVERLVVTPHGVAVQELTAARAARVCIPDPVVAELAGICAKLEDTRDGSLETDVVLTRREGVRVAEVRHVQGRAYPDGGGAATRWSRVGLGESLSGVPTPLTWSLVEAFSERSLDQTLRSLGTKLPRGVSLVGSVRGRFFFNLTELERVLADVPGIGRAAIAGLLGASAGHMDVASGSLPQLSVAAARILARERRLGEEILKFEREAEQQRRWLAEMDLAILPDDALKTTLGESYDFFDRTARLMATSTLALVATYAGLTRVLARSSPVDSPRLAQAITAGVGELDTALPGIALAHVAAIADRDPGARAALTAGADHLEALPAGPARRAMRQLLDAYADRALHESELRVPRWGEDPSALLAMATALMAETTDPEARLSEARVSADRQLAAVEARLPYVEHALVGALVSRWRRLVRLRERMRVWMARTLGMLRVVALDVDRRMRRLDPSLPPDAAFFCTMDELASAVRRARTDLGPLIRMRQARHAYEAALPDAPETFSGAPPPLVLPPTGGTVLHGTGASGGSVVGTARVVGPTGRGARELRPGEVLVLRAPDVGLSPLFLVAGAVVAELGGALSHGAVVAREYGTPAVFGVRGLVTGVRTGERLRVDGDLGVVERLDA